MSKWEIAVLIVSLTLVSSQDFRSTSGIQRRRQRSCLHRRLDYGVTNPQATTYRSGTSVLYSCLAGYELSVSHFSAFATCYDGTWNRPLPRCFVSPFRITTTSPTTTAINQTPRQCGPLLLENGKIEPPNPPYKIGQSASFQCNDGFERKGEEITICLNDGTWALPPPTCEATEKKPKFCNGRRLKNGKSDPDKSVYHTGETVLYKCDVGYGLKGQEVAACFFGNWSAKLPVCEKRVPQVCKRPFFRHGTIYPQKGIYGNSEKILFVCDDGYIRKGERTAECLKGKWTSQLPRCEEKMLKTCEPPPFPHGTISPTKTTYGNLDAVRYRCKSGYRLIGKSTAACFEGKWTPKSPRCEDITKMCKPPTFSHGTVHPLKTLYGNLEVIRFDCERGYSIKGKNTAACSKGKWTAETPHCEASWIFPETSMHCEPPSIVHGSYNPVRESYAVDSAITIDCKNGYFRVGPSKAMCQESGEWSQLGICESGCKEPLIINGYYNTQARKVEQYFSQGSDITINCNPHFVLVGRGEVKCGTNLKWVPQLPVCKKLFQPITPAPRGCKAPSYDFARHSPTLPQGENVYTVGSMITFICKGDAFAVGHDFAECQSNGKWSRKPSCQTGCKEPYIANGYYNTQAVKVGQYLPQGCVITIGCNSGYVLDGKKSSVRCGVNNEWGTKLGVCKRLVEPTPIGLGCAPPSHNFASHSPQLSQGKDFYAVGDRITFVCNGDRFVSGHNFADCLPGGQWSRKPSCTRGCKEPIIINGYYNTQAVKVEQYFSQGSIIIINCNPRYVLRGEGTVRCGAKSEWESKLPICTRVDTSTHGCQAPSFDFATYSPQLPYGKNVYSFGDRITFICEGEKASLRHNFAECQRNGKWSRKPSCPNGCYPPKTAGMKAHPAPPGMGNMYEVGNEVIFFCVLGSSTSATRATCLGKNLWDKTLPSCKIVFEDVSDGCRKPELTEGLIMKNAVQSVYAYKTQFEFQCEVGFHMIGSAVSICRKHQHGLLGGLDPLPPRCQRVKCGSPGKPQNGRFRDGEKREYYFQDTVYFECDDRHIMSGNNHITCQASGQFNGLPPKCQPPSCRVECVYVGGRECQCDAECRGRGDCCGDFEQHCRKLFYSK